LHPSIGQGLAMISWIDVHTHLNMLEVTPVEALAEAKSHGVEQVITIGTQPDDWNLVLNYVTQFRTQVYGTLGVHPHDAEKYNADAEAFLKTHLSWPEIVAVGEIGLDYYYDNAPRDIQKRVFRRQLEIALES